MRKKKVFACVQDSVNQKFLFLFHFSQKKHHMEFFQKKAQPPNSASSCTENRKNQVPQLHAGLTVHRF